MSIEDESAAMQTQVMQLIAGAVQSAGAQGDSYASAKATFRIGVHPLAPGPGGAIRNEQGWLLYPNGVIVTDSEVLYPTQAHGVDPAEIAGSQAWAQKIQDTWSDEKANQWRKTLAGQGYDVATSGGMAHDLLTALGQYHQTRYANGGRVIPLSPGGTQPGELKIKDVVDPVALREEVKSWGQVPFEEDLDDDTADYFANAVMETARRLMKEKGWDASRAVEGAGVRVQKKFLKDENVAGAIEDAEDDEMDESLRESIVSIAQVASI